MATAVFKQSLTGNCMCSAPHSRPTPAVKPAFANYFGSQKIQPVSLSVALVFFRWWKQWYNQLGNWVVSMTTTLRKEHRGTGLPCAGAVPTYLRTTHLLKLLSSEVCNFIGGDYCRLLECVASSRYGLDASDVNITRLVEMLKSSLL